jgi:mxaC protein
VNLAVDHVWSLTLLLLAVPALLGRNKSWRAFPALRAAPVDGASRWLDVFLRLLAAGAIAGIVLGLAGLHRRQHEVARAGRGAHIVLVLDRSLSMDEPFALDGHKATESKTAAAARLIDQFFARRPQDRFGVVAFSTAPIEVLPLTSHRAAVAAALQAMRMPALANTNIGGGLTTALSMFAQDDAAATRVILLVSDGAGYIAEDMQDQIRAAALQQRAHIYYLYLRAGDEPPLMEDMGSHTDATHPAALDGFLRSLGVPYRGFEAADPAAVAAATDAISALETRPITYTETVRRLDYDRACYAVALFCLLLVLLARLAERDIVRLPAPSPTWGPT